jgi:RNA-directed DNA polymerase
MLDRGQAPGQQLELPFAERRGEASVGASGGDTPVGEEQLMERVVERGNLLAALRRVKQNGGSSGIDGRPVEELPGYLREHWPPIREALLVGTYRPQPVKRVEIPKPGGGVRKLGIPTVLDRFIQQAMLQVLQPEWDTTFSDGSYGFRPRRSAHQAIARAQRYLGEGYSWVVDLDLEKFFDRVNHDKLMSLVKRRIADRRALKLIDRYLKAGALTDGGFEATVEGTPQGSPLSPLLANLLLDGLDKELERRGHRFVRYADDCNIYVKSVRAGQRVLASVTRFLARRLKLAVNAAKSAVDRPWRRTFLGFTFTGRRPNRRRVSKKALKACQQEVRRLTARTRGVSLGRVLGELRQYLDGWYAYFGFAEAPSSFKELDSWLRRRLRCYLWKQWGRRRYRELRRRGVSRDLAWNTVKSAHGPWRLSRSPALAIALPGSYFDGLGLPRLHRGAHR